MPRKHRSLVFFAFLILLTLMACTSSDTMPDLPMTRETAGETVWHMITSGRTGSAQIAIMDEGETVFEEGYGPADRSTGEDVTGDTLFNIGSVSKMFVTVSMLLLEDEGLLDLDDPVTDHLEDFVMEDPRHTDITIRMLLNHSSGLPGFTVWNNFGYAYNDAVHDELLDVLSKSHLKHDPGAFMPYCNDGFTLAEMVVSEVSGMSFANFLDTRIFTPLQMSSSGFGVGRETRDSSFARFYRPDGLVEPLEVISMLASGGISSTMRELNMFAHSILKDPEFLSDEAKASLLDHQSALFYDVRDAEGTPFGLGWDYADIPAFQDSDLRLYGKSGGTGHYTTMLFVVPSVDISVSVSMTGAESDAPGVAFDVLEAYLVETGHLDEVPWSHPETHEPEPIPESMLEYEGIYTLGSDTLMLAFDLEAGIMEVSRVYGDSVIPIMDMVHENGRFHGAGQVFFFETVFDTRFLMTWMFSYSGLFGPIPVGERLDPIADPPVLGIDTGGSVWLRADASPYEAYEFVYTHVLEITTSALLPGYINVDGLMEITSETTAGMASSSLRDLFELRVEDREGTPWLWLSGALYMPAETLSAFPATDTSVTIAADGMSVWFVTEEDMMVTSDVPEGARLVVIGPDDIIFDNLIHDGPFFVPAGSLIEVIGDPDDTVTIDVMS